MAKSTVTIDRVRRYIVIDEGANQIVATCGGTHHMMERIIERLERKNRRTYMYDDACQASEYVPQVGKNITLF